MSSAVRAAACVLLGLGAVASPVDAQEKPKATDSKPEPTLEEQRKKAHQDTFEAFKALQAARAAKDKADCEGTPEEKKRAKEEFGAADLSFRKAIQFEAGLADAALKAREVSEEAAKELEAAKKDPTIPKEYKEKANKQSRDAFLKWADVLGEEFKRLIKEYAEDLKKLEQCPPKRETMVPRGRSPFGGGYLGGELVKNSGRVRSTESLAATDLVTNEFTDSGDPLGVGVAGGYNFKPWDNNVIIGPFASFDYLNQTINHNFAGGQFLGTTTHWFINAGVKAGVVTAPGLYLYGLAGAAFLNHDLNVNFATAAQSNVTTPGFTLGFGGEYLPSAWQLAGHPISVFVQYQHTWWSNANFNTPASSPAFNYVFRREDDTVKFGVNFYFGSASAPVSPTYPVKTLPLK